MNAISVEEFIRTLAQLGRRAWRLRRIGAADYALDFIMPAEWKNAAAGTRDEMLALATRCGLDPQVVEEDVHDRE
jgi:hypothetical protein